MPNQGKFLKNTTYLVLCFVKSLPWLAIETFVLKLSISYYRNIVCKNVSCDVGLATRIKGFRVINSQTKITTINMYQGMFQEIF